MKDDVLKGLPDEQPEEEKPLFEKIGGEAAVNAAVDLFYRKVLEDEELSPFFESVDMAEQHKKQRRSLLLHLADQLTTLAKT